MSQNENSGLVLVEFNRKRKVPKSAETHLFWTNCFSQIEACVIAGQHLESKKLLDLLQPKKIPREWAFRFAELANRIHHSIYALKALHRFIAPENTLALSATAQEKMIYAYALSNLGATKEAITLLDSLNAVVLPEVYFLKALCNFREWNYAESIPLLKSYVQAEAVTAYRRIVGEVNLAAALIATSEFDAAIERLNAIQTLCEQNNYVLLLGNTLELKAQAFFFKHEYDEALVCLSGAAAALQGQQGLYSLFVEKWTTLCLLFKNPSAENQFRLRQLRAQAIELSHPETLRECDLFEAVTNRDEALVKKVLFGTPSDHYRLRARTLFGKQLAVRGKFNWSLPKTYTSASNKSQVFMFDPNLTYEGEALYEKPQLLGLFEALTFDFYKPLHLGGLFKCIYPTEQFNPFSSPARVMKLLKRLDGWFEARSIPLRVDFKKSEFSLKAVADVQIVVDRTKKDTFLEGPWFGIRRAFQGRTFTTAKVSEVTGLSLASAQRLVREAVDHGHVISVGKGRNTCYRFYSGKRVRTSA